MTIAEMAAQAQDRLHLSSPASLDRIKGSLKERYAWLLAKPTTRPVVHTTLSANAAIGVRTVEFANASKIFDVFVDGERLDLRSLDVLNNSAVVTDPPTQWATAIVGLTSVTILLNSVPATTFALTADAAAYVDARAISDDDEPAFHANFHDVLIYGAMAIELRRMGQFDAADKMEAIAVARTAGLEAYMKELSL